MRDILPFLIFCVSTGVIASLSGIGLRIASRGEAFIHLRHRLVAAAIGAAVLMLPTLIGPTDAQADPLILLLQAFFGASLACLALLDRMSAWAPDTLTAPAVILAMASGAAGGHWEVGLVAAVLVGIAFFGFVQILWALFARSSLHIPPPPDLYGLSMPVLMFGFSPETVISYALFTVVLLLFRLFPAVRHIFSVPKAMEDASLDMGISAKEGEVVPLLAVICPVLLWVSLLSQNAFLG